jgi:PAS domain S-box-containing protein
MLNETRSQSDKLTHSSALLQADENLQKVRENLHVALMVAFAIMGLPVMGFLVVKWAPLGEWSSLGIGFGAYAMLILITFFRSRISYRGRMIVGFLIYWLLSTLTLYYFGLSGPGFWFFIAFCVINSLLYGSTFGLICLAISLATIIPIGLGMATGVIGINLADVQNSLSMQSWAVAAALFTMLAVAMIFSQGIVYRHLQNAYRDEFDLREKQEITNALLRVQLTKIEQARREAAEQESRYLLLANHISDVIWTATLGGRITYMSPSAIRFHGYDPEELAKLSWETLMTEESRSKLRDAFIEIRNKTEFEPDHYMFVEIELLHKFGNIVPIEMSLSRIVDPLSGKMSVVGVARDISQRKNDEREREKLELQLRQAQKMEAIGQLAGGVAHDFNNLLTGITGNIELSLLDLDTQDPIHESLLEAKHAAERAATLTRQLLTFSRKQIIEPRPIDINVLVRNLINMLGRLLGESVVIRLELQDELPLIVADPGQIEQVIVNLAVNARDAMTGGGTLTLTTLETDLSADLQARTGGQPGRYVCLRVSDSGTGMDSLVMRHLFEPFFTTKPVGKGTGLGLSTVYGVVSQHDGVIDVQSELGKGSCFSVYLPSGSADETDSSSAAENHLLPVGNERLLIVEDDTMVRSIAVRMLKRLGYEVAEAANAAEALLVLERASAPFDLMLTDLVMPGLSGRELAERVAQISPGTRVLYTSGYTEDSTILNEITRDEVDFLPKPYTPRAIAVAVRAALDQPVTVKKG